MKAELLLHERQQVETTAFVESKNLQVTNPVKGSKYLFKYLLAYVVEGTYVLRYGNESGKGDHKHIDEKKCNYSFVNAEQLLQDFWIDVDEWKKE